RLVEIPTRSKGLIPVVVRSSMLAAESSMRRILLLVLREVRAAECCEALDRVNVGFRHAFTPVRRRRHDRTTDLRNPTQNSKNLKIQHTNFRLSIFLPTY